MPGDLEPIIFMRRERSFPKIEELGKNRERCEQCWGQLGRPDGSTVERMLSRAVHQAVATLMAFNQAKTEAAGVSR